jgi:hypothetical protein
LIDAFFPAIGAATVRDLAALLPLPFRTPFFLAFAPAFAFLCPFPAPPSPISAPPPSLPSYAPF